MTYVIIKGGSPTMDGTTLPLYMYTIPLRVLEDNDNCIGVLYDNKSYWFSKHYIDRCI